MKCEAGVAGKRGKPHCKPLTDGHVITERKSMLLDFKLPHTFFGLAAGHTDVDDSCIALRRLYILNCTAQGICVMMHDNVKQQQIF